MANSIPWLSGNCGVALACGAHADVECFARSSCGAHTLRWSPVLGSQLRPISDQCMTGLRPHAFLRSVSPLAVRRAAARLHPGQAKRWRSFPGITTVDGLQAVLTFDDGPSPDATPAVLRELSRCSTTATFFVLGQQVTRHPEISRAIADGGHEIGLHGNGHVRYDQLSAEEVRRELAAGIAAVERITGRYPKWFRPPFGRMSTAAEEACHDLSLAIAYWSATGFDWEAISTDAVVSEATRRLGPGTILLLHDAADFGKRRNAQPTALALPDIIEAGRSRGLTWRTLSDAT